MVPESFFLYLASQSPRRSELLRQIGVPFVLLTTEPVDESALPGETPSDLVMRLARAKAQSGGQALKAGGLQPAPVLAADTIVCLDELIFGKPKDAAEARSMLQQLSGRTHRVCTAIAIICDETLEEALNESEVSFATLDPPTIERYLATGEAFDKAGAYGIQGHAAAFISRIEGSYSGIMGLPLYELSLLLEHLTRRIGTAFDTPT